MTLRELGWNPFFEEAFAPLRVKGWVPARLIRESPINFGAFLEGGEEIDVVLCGRVWHEAANDAELPAVGDWVALELGHENRDHVIRERLPRQTCFSRKMPGNSSQAQVIGANVDVAPHSKHPRIARVGYTRQGTGLWVALAVAHEIKRVG